MIPKFCLNCVKSFISIIFFSLEIQFYQIDVNLLYLIQSFNFYQISNILNFNQDFRQKIAHCNLFLQALISMRIFAMLRLLSAFYGEGKQPYFEVGKKYNEQRLDFQHKPSQTRASAHTTMLVLLLFLDLRLEYFGSDFQSPKWCL